MPRGLPGCAKKRKCINQLSTNKYISNLWQTHNIQQKYVFPLYCAQTRDFAGHFHATHVVLVGMICTQTYNMIQHVYIFIYIYTYFIYIYIHIIYICYIPLDSPSTRENGKQAKNTGRLISFV